MEYGIRLYDQLLDLGYIFFLRKLWELEKPVNYNCKIFVRMGILI